EQLREITGQKYDSLSRPGVDMPLASPNPAAEQQWVDMSMEQNLQLIADRLQADTARAQVQSAFGNHLPTVDITGTKSHATGDGTAQFGTLSGLQPEGPFPTDSKNETYGLAVTVPIFSGGLTQSRVRQAQYTWIAAKERVTRTSRA